MATELKHSREMINQTGQALIDAEPIKQEWDTPYISQQLTVSARMFRLIESYNSLNESQLVVVSHDLSPTRKLTKDLPDYVSDTKPNPIYRKIAERSSPEQKTTVDIIKIRAYCFSNFELEIEGKRVDKWHSLKAKSLLKFLLAHRNKPVSKDVLIELLWPDCDPEEGKNNLKAVVYSLRQTLIGQKEQNQASQLILFSEGQYLINPEVELWVDVTEFEQHWLTGRNLEKNGKKEEALREFCLAEELYRGDYLEEDRYSDWTQLQREALRDIYLAILCKLASNSFDVADFESCILYSQKILLKDVCHEEAYRWIMYCYGRMGNPRRALQWYKVCADTLKKELDTVPDIKTTDLYRRLLKQESV